MYAQQRAEHGKDHNDKEPNGKQGVLRTAYGEEHDLNRAMEMEWLSVCGKRIESEINSDTRLTVELCGCSGMGETPARDGTCEEWRI